ncbi:MAG: hypothetical protein DI536_34420 [Archangium gephyra]|uniref:Uncharacterized protein n=1 Tax=Archangium gephyra TaxID=48 RepID=A0A2W5SMI5_9BACT|nr:MAG: hypothetical protein DI536_34420 [Archangium gephyra]
MISTSRFENLSVTSSAIAELLQPLTDRNARECFERLSTLAPRMRAEHLAVERAREAMTAAKAETRRINTRCQSLIVSAVRIGNFLGYAEMSDVANNGDEWPDTIEALITAFRARGEDGKPFADRFSEIISESRAVAAELNRATAEYARATTAFSVECRALSKAIAFARAVLTNLGVSMPRVAPKKAKSPSPSPAVVPENVPAPAPTQLPAPPPTV